MGDSSVGPIDHNNPAISPHYRAGHWRRWRNCYNIDSSSVDWQDAVDIFYDRLNGRFLAPIDAIINHSDSAIQEFSGFAIMALDCLIIETLTQFYHGRNDTLQRQGNATFQQFLTTSVYFQNEFDNGKAEAFYDHFRNGLLHQAQTKGKSKIRINEPQMVQQINPRNVNDGLIIDRKRFHNALLDEISDYKQRLLHPSTQNDHTLRQNFVTKMDFIAS